MPFYLLLFSKMKDKMIKAICPRCKKGKAIELVNVLPEGE
jgi:hypothetical protein